MKKLTLFALVLIAVFSLVLGASCTQRKETAKKKASKETKKQSTPDGESTTTAIGDQISVMMLGRSVMAGWFTHWISDSTKPYRHDGFILYPYEIDSPPDIVKSVKAKVDKNSHQTKIVFFKLCFADFYGGSREEAKTNLAQNKKYIEHVYQFVVKDRGLRLIIGNALPQTKKSTTMHLVWNHREYNNWLKDFAAQHAGEVYVFDQYSLLSDADGNLKKQYTSDPEDSHPNDAGYSALDTPFFQLLKSIKL